MTRVLIVDDKEENIYYLRALLGAHGCDVATASNGAEALAQARETLPDLVVSDLLMPVMDGYTLLRHWKADPCLKEVPFVVYTATYTAPEDEQLALRLGADAFILKPSEPDVFFSHIEAVRAKSAAAQPVHIHEPVGNDVAQLREYSAALIRKLERRSLQLEEANRALQKDIAAREQVELALRDSEERFRQLAESIDDVFWLSSWPDGVLLYMSPEYESLWGRSRESLFANPQGWLAALHEDDRERVGKSLEGYASGSWDETYRVVHSDGSLRWIRARAYPVLDASGRVHRIAGVSRDVTEYRRLEEQFRQAQKMEAIGRLAGGVAHDFNNLLSVILSYASLASDELAPESPARDHMEQVRRAGERAASLTRQLLAFSRHQLIRARVVDLGQVVADTEKMLWRLLGEDVELAVIPSNGPTRVYADPNQIEQVVLNLVVNARDAMPHGGKLTIEVRIAELDAAYAASHPGVAPGRYVLLTVQDTGIGMDEATLDRSFEPFFTTKAKGKGTGLGLSTVFGIVTQSDGHVQVRSQLGSGTTFSVYLPCTDRPLDLASESPPSLGTLRGSETILLVEDDDQVREMSRTILTRNGYDILDAPDGCAASLLSDAFAGNIDLLVTDVVMPRMSGRELAECLAPKRPAMKVLYVSGYTEDAIVHHGVLGSGIAFLQKPITPEALLRKVREVLTPHV